MNLIANIDDTIVAIASSHERAGQRGIVRASGPGVLEIAKACFRVADGRADAEEDHGLEVCVTEGRRWDTDRVTTAQRFAGVVDLPDLGQVPCDLYLWPDERSYTRQPTAEFHTLGAVPVLQALMAQICQCGARLAEPGEFTLRSFLAGRLDLAQAEAVLGVIDATNDREIQVALTQLAGGLSAPLTQLRDTLINLVADLEAGLDFVDEDIEFIETDQVLQALEQAEQTIAQTLQQIGQRDAGGQLPRVVLYGEPNVGKSSLWNALVEEGQALVDATAGTTRDYLVGTVSCASGEFQLVDTAGVEGAADPIQQSMQRLGDSQVATAHLLLLCIDASRPRTDWEQQQLATPDARRLVVHTKCDLGEDFESCNVACAARTRPGDAEALQQLVETIFDHLNSLRGEMSVVANTASRCRESLRMAHDSIQRARELVVWMAGDELVVSDLRTALDQIGLVVGAIYTDDILDRVFSRFCIGK